MGIDHYIIIVISDARYFLAVGCTLTRFLRKIVHPYHSDGTARIIVYQLQFR